MHTQGDAVSQVWNEMDPDFNPAPAFNLGKASPEKKKGNYMPHAVFMRNKIDNAFKVLIYIWGKMLDLVIGVPS